jgi:hypothetical protein
VRILHCPMAPPRGSCRHRVSHVYEQSTLVCTRLHFRSFWDCRRNVHCQSPNTLNYSIQSFAAGLNIVPGSIPGRPVQLGPPAPVKMTVRLT